MKVKQKLTAKKCKESLIFGGHHDTSQVMKRNYRRSAPDKEKVRQNAL